MNVCSHKWLLSGQSDEALCRGSKELGENLDNQESEIGENTIKKKFPNKYYVNRIFKELSLTLDAYCLCLQ